MRYCVLSSCALLWSRDVAAVAVICLHLHHRK
jgi:hypothetical protein